MNWNEYHTKLLGLYKEVKDLKEKFLEEHKSFDIGDIVRVTSCDRNSIGIVDDNKITSDSRHEVIPVITKLNKNGTRHANGQELWILRCNEVELVKKAEKK